MSLVCPPCGDILAADDEESLVAVVRAHSRAHHGSDVSPEYVLAELHATAHASAG